MDAQSASLFLATSHFISVITILIILSFMLDSLVLKGSRHLLASQLLVRILILVILDRRFYAHHKLPDQTLLLTLLSYIPILHLYFFDLNVIDVVLYVFNFSNAFFIIFIILDIF